MATEEAETADPPLMGPSRSTLSIAVVEPHLRPFGGIRRILELTNRLVDRGHDVTIHLPAWERAACTWMSCRARIAPIPQQLHRPYDVVMFNEESQWFLLDHFLPAARRVHYALSVGRLYGKEGSWEAVRMPVDLRLANSSWTADQIESEIGERPIVLTGGVDRTQFHPVDVPRRYPILCIGDPRPNKGTDVIVAAARRLGLPVEMFGPKNLPQSALAAEYSAAEVFVVGSYHEGFGQPGLEALACGTPLVTTDNGGCRDYAIHGETALVVPTGDVEAMAAAIDAVRNDPELAARLRRNGLALVSDAFDWDHAADRFEELLLEVTAAPPSRRTTPSWRRGSGDDPPELSVVIRADDAVLPLQRCIESLRRHTDVPYELVVVNDSTSWEAAAYADAAADVSVRGPHDGLAAAWNAGADAASGQRVCFLDPAVRVSECWVERATEALSGGRKCVILSDFIGASAESRIGRDTSVLEISPFTWPLPLHLVFLDAGMLESLGHLRAAMAETFFDLWVAGEEVCALSAEGFEIDDERLRRRDVETLAAAAGAPSDDWFTRMAAMTPTDRRAVEALIVATRLRAAQRRARLRANLRRPFRVFSRWVVLLVRLVWGGLRSAMPASIRARLFPVLRRPYYRLFPDRHPQAHRYGRSPTRR